MYLFINNCKHSEPNLFTICVLLNICFREVSVQICDEPDIVTKGDANSSDDNDEEDKKGENAE